MTARMVTVGEAVTPGRNGRRRRQVMTEPWAYWRLENEEGLVIGFMRVSETQCHYVGLRGQAWQVKPIEYADRIRLAGPLLGFGYLEEPECSSGR